MPVENRASHDYFQRVMFENRSYVQRGPGRIRWSATLVLVVTLVIAYIIQSQLISPAAADYYFALSLQGLKHGYYMQLLTFQFMHGGWLHLLLNCWAIYLFGREVERALGAVRFLALYFASGVAGGLLQMLLAWIWPLHFGGAVVGASAGGFGLVAAFAAIYPDRPLMMLLFFVVPMKMRAKSLLVFCLALSAAGIVYGAAFPDSLLGGRIAHAAHLGGILTGLASALWFCGSARPHREATVFNL